MRRTKAEARQTREAVLTAAVQVILRQGVGAFTLETVAHAAGVTKGGVLHHFPSKEALLEGVIDRVMASFEARLAAALAAEPPGQPGRWLRAYIRSMFAAEGDEVNLIPALATTVGADHQTLARIRALVAASQQAAAGDGLDPTRAALVRLAVDGVVFGRALGIDVLAAGASRKVQAELIRLTQ